MVDKGRIMSQAFYEKQARLYKLIQEAFQRKESNDAEAYTALRKLGFGEKVAVNRVNEWKVKAGSLQHETEIEKKRRKKERVLLERYFHRLVLIWEKRREKKWPNLKETGWF